MASTGVNRPTNVKQKEQDVNQKLQLYGIFTGKWGGDGGVVLEFGGSD